MLTDIEIAQQSCVPSLKLQKNFPSGRRSWKPTAVTKPSSTNGFLNVWKMKRRAS